MSKSIEGLSGGAVKPSGKPSRRCTSCYKPISPARLKIKPNATQCVPCLEADGDVLPLRRLDESTRNGGVQTYFTSDPYKEIYLLRQRFEVPPDGALELTTGDDQFLKSDVKSIRHEDAEADVPFHAMKMTLTLETLDKSIPPAIKQEGEDARINEAD